jgi:uncharacterized membrane protein YkvA (DUF1232 family)
MGLFAGLRARARALRGDVVALYLVARDRRTPFLVKLAIGLVVAYALSPVDLVPDFIPIIGLLDDVILVPMAIALVLRFVPRHVMADARANAPAALARAKRLGWVGLGIVIALWVGIVIATIQAIRWLVAPAA